MDLRLHGPARLGEPLPSTEASESIKRGGDGYCARLEGGWLSLDSHRARKLRPQVDAISLYLRAWLDPDQEGSLFFSDFLSLTVGRGGLAIAFLGARTPSGKTFRELPLGVIQRGQWLDLLIRLGHGRLQFYCNGALIAAPLIPESLAAPFDDDLLIGAFKCDKPDFYGTDEPFAPLYCRIDTVALWDYALSDRQIYFLSSVPALKAGDAETPVTQAFSAYNAFFDASIRKDVETCATLWGSLQKAARLDPLRPSYHLTQPLGCIFDPCGAFFYAGNYHVFSYRNIFSLLNYSSLDHYVSRDLVHWTEWPIAPFADSDVDVYSIYLLNHFIDDDGTPRVLYTGEGVAGKFGILGRSTDGLVSYTDKKAVLTKYHHDGHVWKEGGVWYTITSRMYKGARPGNLGDAVMLWSSSNLEQWQEIGEIFTQPKRADSQSDAEKVGFMEFPYLIPFQDQDVLLLGGHPVRYYVGHFDRQAKKFLPDRPEGLLLDYTNPFHCDNPLCVDQQGAGGAPRRIIMALYAAIEGGGPGLLPWSGVHAMPRVLTLAGDHLRQDPLPEFEKLRGEHFTQKDLILRPGISGYVGQRGHTLEILAEFEPGDAHSFGLKVHQSQDRSRSVRIFYDASTGAYGVDGDAAASGQGPAFVAKGQRVQMHVFLDKLLIETFVNGLTCTTCAQTKDLSSDGLDLFSEGGSARCTQLDIWNLDNP